MDYALLYSVTKLIRPNRSSLPTSLIQRPGTSGAVVPGTSHVSRTRHEEQVNEFGRQDMISEHITIPNETHRDEFSHLSGSLEAPVPQTRSHTTPQSVSGGPAKQAGYSLRPPSGKLPERQMLVNPAQSKPSATKVAPPARSTWVPQSQRQDHRADVQSYLPRTEQQITAPRSHHNPNMATHQPTSSPYGSYLSVERAHGYQLLLEEAREICFKGRDLPFIFFQNQITQLLKRCPDPNRKMDLLRASCQDEARQAISAMVPPVPVGMSIRRLRKL